LIEIEGAAGISQSGCSPILIDISGQRSEIPAPARFRFPSETATGDWWIDDRLPREKIFSSPVDLPPEFTLFAKIHGRFEQELTIRFSGDPGFSVGFRRGWLNNDIFIRDISGRTIASAAIDPVPTDRLCALLATVLSVLCVALLISALFPRNNPRVFAPVGVSRKRYFYLAALLLSGLGVAQSAWISRDILGGLPHTPDEVVYNLQSRWILDGSLTAEQPQCPELIDVPLTYYDHGRWKGHYPPLWPTLLTPGTALGIPTLVPVILHGLFLFLVFLLGRRTGGEFTGMVALLLALGSPLAAVLFSTTLSDGACAVLLLGALVAALPGDGKHAPWISDLLMGCCLAAAFGIRPLTTIAAALPLGWYLCGRPGTWRRLAMAAAGAAPILVMVFAANQQITGNWWSFPYALAGKPMMGPAFLPWGLRNVDTLLAAVPPFLTDWSLPFFPGSLIRLIVPGLAALPFVSRSSKREDRLFLLIFGASILVLLPARAHGLHGYGPRYLFSAFAPLWVLAGRGIGLLTPSGGRRRFAFLVVLSFLLLLAPAVLPRRLTLYRGYNDVDGDLHTAMSNLPGKSLIIVEPGNWRVWAESSPWPGCSDALDVVEPERLIECFPDRKLYRWNRTEGLFPENRPGRCP